jgi:hypothetical protein
MKKLTTRLAWAGAILLAAATLVWRLAPLPDAQARIAPLAAGPGQRLERMEFAAWEVDFFGKAKAIRWLAQGRGAAVVATVVDGSGNRRAVHDPGYCFRGAGWTVVAETPLWLAHGEAVQVQLKREGAELEAVYWFSDGRSAYASPMRYWRESTLRRLTLGRSGDEPVLILLVPAQGTKVDWPGWLARWPQFDRI